MGCRKYSYIISILLCLEYLINGIIAQGTTASFLATTRPLDLDDDETSGEDLTTTDSTTSEDLFSTTNSFSDSSTTAEEGFSQTTPLLTTQQTVDNTTIPLTTNIATDTTQAVSTTVPPNVDITTTDDGGQSAETSFTTRESIATTPLSEIDDDDELTTNSATPSATPSSSSIETSGSTTTSSTADTSTVVSLPTISDRTSSSPLRDSSTSRTISQPNTRALMTGCTEDRDCASNQHCVSANSSSECACKPGYAVSDNGLCIEKIKHFGGRVNYVNNGTISPQRYREITSRLVNAAFSSQPWFKSINIINFAENPTSVSYELVTEDEENVNAALIDSIFEGLLETDTSFEDGCACEQEQCSIENVILLATDTCRDTGQVNAVLCEESLDISQYCDDETTTCAASEDGRISCPCKSGFVFNTDNSCIRLICINDTNCNYGACDQSTPGGECFCQWGFNGTHCDDPWLLVTTVLLSFAVVLLLAVATYFALRRKWKQRKSKILDKQEALSQEPKYGYRKNNERYNVSPWQEGPVVPKSYKRVGPVTAHVSTIPTAPLLSPAQSVSILRVSDSAIQPKVSSVPEVQVSEPPRVEREASRLAPTEFEVSNIRNIARRKRSISRERPNDRNIDFVLPNQVPDS